MESINKRRGYSNFELSCCLETVISEYEEKIQKASNDFKEVQNDSNWDRNDSEENIRDRVELLQALKAFIDDSEDNVLMDKSEEKTNTIRYSILDVLELDRKRIARDLHDSSVQLLTMLVHKAELCEKLMEIDTIRTKVELHLMGEFLKDAISELRQTIFDLRPMTMDDLGLMDSIERYIQMLIQSSEIQFRITAKNDNKQLIEDILKPVEKLSVYRVLQECCSNIIKHSKATKALISLNVEGNSLYLQVDDNGVGFKDKQKMLQIDELNKSMNSSNRECFDVLTSMLANREDFTGYGLSMLYERVYLLKGTLKIETGENGTSICIRIPVDTKEEKENETNKDYYCG